MARLHVVSLSDQAAEPAYLIVLSGLTEQDAETLSVSYEAVRLPKGCAGILVLPCEIEVA